MIAAPSPNQAVIVNVLREGPATTAELHAELGWARQLVSAHLSILRQKGLVRGVQFSKKAQRLYLWSLTEETNA